MLQMSAPRLSIVVPIYNEEATLRTIFEKVVSACGDFCEVIMVNDGSSDNSYDIAQSLAREQDTVLTKENGGKGSAVRMGYEHAKGRYTIVQDADLEYFPTDIEPLLAAAEAQNLPAVYGSRRMHTRPEVAHIKYYIGGVMLTYYTNLLYLIKLSDQNTCYKLVRTDLIQSFPLRQNDFRFDIEMTVFLARNGHHITEMPISYQPRNAEEGKKIGYSDWFKSVWLLTAMRFWPKSKLQK